MIDTDADRLALLMDFGVSATFNGNTITGILDNEYEGVDVGAEVEFALSTFKFTCRTSDIPNVAFGNQITINSVVYNIVVIMPDGQGMTELQLEKD
jgi:hypothetical protein